MANILDYLDWRGDLTFVQAPFNEVDNLILTQLIYLDLDAILPGPDSDASMTLSETAVKYFGSHLPDEIEQMPPLLKNAAELLRAMVCTARFSDCRLSKYINDVSEDEESQFSVVTITLNDDSTFLSFSGTDVTIIGWKENFNMGFLAETPAQEKALDYICAVVPHCPGTIRIGGHSKGGNLAVYAAMHAPELIQDRLTAIYNNDGPGFTEKMISENGYQRVLARIHTYMPQSSIVGILLQHEENVEVIHSSTYSFKQHDAFTWDVLGTQFVHLDGLSKESILLDRTVKNWITGMDDEQTQAFVDALFSVLEQAQIQDTMTLSHMTPAQLAELMKSAEKLPQEHKQVLHKTGLQLMHSWVEILKHSAHSKADQA